MTTGAATRLAQWWVHGTSVVDRAEPVVAGHVARAIALGATREEFTAVLAARAWRWAGRQLQRLRAAREPQSVQELLAYARSIEHCMPSLAADLRAAALRHDATTV